MWVGLTIKWYISLFFLGLIFFPIARRLLPAFRLDLGYPFAKTVAIITVTFTIFTLGTLRFLPFTQESLVIILFGIIILYVVTSCKKGFLNFSLKGLTKTYPLNLIIIEEIVFLVALFFWIYVRGQEPSIRGLEKFMDYGFMKSISRSTYFPPLDMWLAGKTINYYYFGHMSGAVLSKLSGIAMEYAYNLILATIFATGITQTFSLVANIVYTTFKKQFLSIMTGFLGSFIVNLGGNLHTIYTFTKGYPNEQPIPFWKIMSWWNPGSYWYPNATRFIPFTIHEFPIYSYVVADLHGHVFDISFVLLTLAVLFNFFYQIKQNTERTFYQLPLTFFAIKQYLFRPGPKIKHIVKKYISPSILQHSFAYVIILGFLCAVHYMTNAFDGPIYLLLSILFLILLFGWSLSLALHLFGLIVSFVIFTLPFSSSFSPFVSGIGVNCSPSFLVKIEKFGPFLFEKGNCQISPLYMIFLLWGFFWLSFFFLIVYLFKNKKNIFKTNFLHIAREYIPHLYIFVLFAFSTFLIIIPEFFYMKDIYPGHFRANTMFKLGYQAFIMMGIGIAFTFSIYKTTITSITKKIYFFLFFIGFFFISIYPSFAITSYYGKLEKNPEVNGIAWMDLYYPEYKEIITYLNERIIGQPTILEAQGDSYTDFNVVSAYTGLPTVAGWWVHEWLWRGSSDAVGLIAPEIQQIYETEDVESAKTLLKKYNVRYLIIGPNEEQKYTNLSENKFSKLGNLIFESTLGQGARLYQIR